MPNTQQLTVMESLEGKFGPQIKDAKGYLNFSKFYTGPTEFVPGTVLEVDIYASPKGNRYVNSAKIIREAEVNEHTPPKRKPRKIVTAALENVSVPAVSTASVSSFKPRDFDAENKGKTRCALLAGMVANPNVLAELTDEGLENMMRAVDNLVEYVFNERKEKV